MHDAGLDVEVFELDLEALARHPLFSTELSRTRALGVVGRRGSATAPRCCSTPTSMSCRLATRRCGPRPPWQATVEGDLVYGRGTCDTKGGLAAAIEAAGTRPPELGPVLVASVIGEEDGGAGTIGLLEHGVRADAARGARAHPPRHRRGPSRALSFRLRVPGRAAHGCLRAEGESAIEHFDVLHRALLDLERRRNERDPDPLFAHLDRPYALCIGRLEAGDWASSVPDWLRWRAATAWHQARTSTRPARARSRSRSGAASNPWLAEHPPTVEWWGGQYWPARTDPAHPLVTSLAARSPR